MHNVGGFPWGRPSRWSEGNPVYYSVEFESDGLGAWDDPRVMLVSLRDNVASDGVKVATTQVYSRRSLTFWLGAEAFVPPRAVPPDETRKAIPMTTAVTETAAPLCAGTTTDPRRASERLVVLPGDWNGWPLVPTARRKHRLAIVGGLQVLRVEEWEWRPRARSWVRGVARMRPRDAALFLAYAGPAP
jgi:hypothetical protein